MNALLDQHEMGSLLGQALLPQEPGLLALATTSNNVNGQRFTQQTGPLEQTINDD